MARVKTCPNRREATRPGPIDLLWPDPAGQDIDVQNVNIDNDAIRGGWWWLMMTWPRDGYRGAFGVDANDDAALALAHSVAMQSRRKTLRNAPDGPSLGKYRGGDPHL